MRQTVVGHSGPRAGEVDIQAFRSSFCTSVKYCRLEIREVFACLSLQNIVDGTSIIDTSMTWMMCHGRATPGCHD